MDEAKREQILREQEEKKRVQRERDARVDRVARDIKKGVTIEDIYRAQGYVPTLLAIVEKIIINAQRGQASRQQYADGQGSLAGVDLSLTEIDCALDIICKIREIT